MKTFALVKYQTNDLIFKIEITDDEQKPYMIHLNDKVNIKCDEQSFGEIVSLVLENLNEN